MDLLLGPLAGPECRRALDRGRILWIRLAATLPAVLIVLSVMWFWWFNQQVGLEIPAADLLRGSCLVLVWLLLAGALIIAPALVAGSLASDRMRGTLDMLLASHVTPREIVLGKLTGRLSIAAVMLLASLPGLVLLASLCGLNWTAFAAAVGLPIAAAMGAAGTAMAISAASRRGRDALMATYVLMLAVPITAALAANVVPAALQSWLLAANPFHGLVPLFFTSDPSPAWRSVSLWTTIFFLGVVTSSWTLRPSLMATQRAGRGRRRRKTDISARIGDRPLFWKEIHIERPGRTNRWTHVLTLLVAAVVLLGTIAMVAIKLWPWADPQLKSSAHEFLAVWSRSLAFPLGWLIQWAMGIRAAVGIATEREQGTWDALLVSPLEGHEIVTAKLCGSLFALRWLLAAALLTWTLQWLAGAMDGGDYADWMAKTLVVSTFMAVVGVAASLTNPSTTRAMTITLGIWFLASLGTWVVALWAAMFLTLLNFLAAALVYWSMGNPFSSAFPSTGLVPISFEAGMLISRLAIYGVFAVFIAFICRARFDRFAGRTAAQTVPQLSISNPKSGSGP